MEGEFEQNNQQLTKKERRELRRQERGIQQEKRQNKKPQELSLKAKKIAYSLAEQQQIILESFPGVGATTAKELLKKFKTIKNFVLANTKEIAKIKRLGEKKAKEIKDIITKRYKEK